MTTIRLLTLLASAMAYTATMAQMYVWRNGNVVLAIEDGTADSITFVKPQEPPAALSDAKFSVAPGKQVRFSPGNLLYNDYEYIWQFAENQYDIVGTGNSRIGPGYNGWIDLFGWGSSGWGGEDWAWIDPTTSSTDYHDYIVGDSWANGLTGHYWGADWGANSNYITNGEGIQWRTLSSAEWDYLLVNRAQADKKFALATVVGQAGLVVLPDEWELPDGLSFTPCTDSKMKFDSGLYIDDDMTYDHFTANTYNAAQWQKMERAGALFLPAGGRRWGTTIKNSNWGLYWSTTAGAQEREGNVCALQFYMSGVTPRQETSRAYGCSVRLVHDIQ